ncbi:MAG: hypothetical protein KDA75_16455 [Planctomycetaceae bacterium]|nr:hypothetical protein [Planctomycetaceae bacterium]
MSDTLYDQLRAFQQSGDADGVVDRLIESLRDQRRWHKLFDARMLKCKASLGLPVSRPASLQDVPPEHRKEVETAYVEAAREAGQAFLDAGDIPSAWMYFQVIREPQPVREAIDSLPATSNSDENLEQVMRIALFEGVHPIKGIEMMLRLHGTCSTITSLDQAIGQLPQDDRRACAALMVRELYRDLRENVEREVQQKLAMLPPGQSLRELIAGRDWLFNGGNYHIDVSHLNAVVRFARSIEDAEDLELATELAEYGCHLHPQLQYAGDPPFEDFYPSHRQFFNALLDRDRDDAIGYFQDKLDQEPDERDKPLLAYVLVDLLVRCGREDEAVDLAARYLTKLSDEVTLSFFDLCLSTSRYDALREAMQANDDPVGYASAIVAETRHTVPSE